MANAFFAPTPPASHKRTSKLPATPRVHNNAAATTKQKSSFLAIPTETTVAQGKTQKTNFTLVETREHGNSRMDLLHVIKGLRPDELEYREISTCPRKALPPDGKEAAFEDTSGGVLLPNLLLDVGYVL